MCAASACLTDEERAKIVLEACNNIQIGHAVSTCEIYLSLKDLQVMSRLQLLHDDYMQKEIRFSEFDNYLHEVLSAE